MANIQGIYIALFGRPADPGGLAYFNAVTKGGTDLKAIGDLAGTQEYQDRFKGMNPAEIVTAIYRSLLGREPEASGLAFWVDKLASNSLNVNTIAIAVLDGAIATDRQTVEAKIAIADAFTASLNTPEKIAAYVGIDAARQIQSYLSGVTWEKPGSPSDLQTIVDHLAAPVVGGGGGGGAPAGLNVSLTAGDDHIVGTASADMVSGIVGSNAPTFGPNDTIDGGAGIDTLKLALNSAVTIDGTKVTNIENVVFSQLMGSGTFYGVDLTSVAGISQVTLEDAPQGGGISVQTAKPVALALRNTNGGMVVSTDLSGANDKLAVTLDHAGTAGVYAGINPGNSQSDSYEAVSITSTGSAINYFSLGNMPFANGTILKIDGTAGLDLQLGLQVGSHMPLTAIDATAASGGVTLDFYWFAESASLPTVSFGSGNDTLKATNMRQTLTADGGAGTDRIAVSAGTDLSQVTNFEIVRIAPPINQHSTAAEQGVSGFKTIEIDDGTGTQLTLRNVANDAEIDLIQSNINQTRLALMMDNTTAGDKSVTLKFGVANTQTGISFLTDSSDISVLKMDTGAALPAGQHPNDSRHSIYSDQSAARHVITGAADLGIYNLTAAAQVDASAMTGSLTLYAQNSLNHTIETGSGNDEVRLGTGNDNVSTGAGNDTVYVDTLTSGDVLDGGSGTDKLVLSSGGADLSRVSNFEILRMENNSGFEQSVGTFKAIEFDGSNQGMNASLTGLLNDSTVALHGPVDNLILTLANGGGANDILTLRLDGFTVTSGTSISTGLETLNIQVTENTQNSLSVNTAAKLVLSGAGNLSLSSTATVVDASAMTGNLEFGANGAGADHTVTLGTGADTVNLAYGRNDVITLGKTGVNAQSGADTINLGPDAYSDKVVFVGSNNAVTGDATSYTGLARVTGFGIANDKIGFSADNADFRTLATGADESAAVTGLAKGTIAKGLVSGDTMVMQSLGDLAGFVMAEANVSFIKLTHAASLGSGAGQFHNVLYAAAEAINGSTVDGLAQGANYLVSYFDSSYGNGAGAAILTVVNTGDDRTLTASDFGAGFSVVGIVQMSSTDYQTFSASNLIAA